MSRWGDWFHDYDSYARRNSGVSGPSLYPGVEVGYGQTGGYPDIDNDPSFFAETPDDHHSLGGRRQPNFTARSTRWGAMRPNGYNAGSRGIRRFGRPGYFQ